MFWRHVDCECSDPTMPPTRHLLLYSKNLAIKATQMKTTSLLRPVLASPKWYFPYDIVFDIKTTSYRLDTRKENRFRFLIAKISLPSL